MQILAWILFILSVINAILVLFLILASDNCKERIRCFFNLIVCSLELVFMVNYLFLM